VGHGATETRTIIEGEGGQAITVIAALRGLRGMEKSGVACATAKAGLLGLSTNLADAYGAGGVRFNVEPKTSSVSMISRRSSSKPENVPSNLTLRLAPRFAFQPRHGGIRFTD
jgi:NAD(P)-dependent dehydrogenase (short-subunit alcohol dehydrogenase family)